METQVFKSLKDVATERHCSHETARRAAVEGKIPAFQLWGKGSTWLVHPGYENFLNKSRNAERSADAAEQQENNETIKQG